MPEVAHAENEIPASRIGLALLANVLLLVKALVQFGVVSKAILVKLTILLVPAFVNVGKLKLPEPGEPAVNTI